MKHLGSFLHDVEVLIEDKGFDDVLDLIPYFEELEVQNWKAMLNTEDGKPVNTTIFQSDHFRIVIIHWDGHQQSSIHGHVDGGGLIKVLEGVLEETRFDPEDKDVTGQFTYTPGNVTYIHDMIALHQVKNPEGCPAYSLHLYTRQPRFSES